MPLLSESVQITVCKKEFMITFLYSVLVQSSRFLLTDDLPSWQLICNLLFVTSNRFHAQQKDAYFKMAHVLNLTWLVNLCCRTECS